MYVIDALVTIKLQAMVFKGKRAVLIVYFWVLLF